MISDPVKIALIVAIGPFILGLTSTILGYLNRSKLDEVHKSTNSRLDELVKAVTKVAHAEGMEAQRQIQRQIDKPKP